MDVLMVGAMMVGVCPHNPCVATFRNDLNWQPHRFLPSNAALAKLGIIAPISLAEPLYCPKFR